MTSVLQLADVCKSYKQGNKSLDILDHIDLSLKANSITALVGKSGAGKSTLLQVAGMLDEADSGAMIIDGVDGTNLSKDRRAELRAAKIGFVYQAHHLLSDFTAAENVMMPLLIQGVHKKIANEKALDMLSRLGLADRATHRPGQLSGGEQQRVAIGRALVHKPKLLLADEPTGNLDEDTSDRVLALLMEVIKETGVAALIATHDRKLAASMDRTIELSHGELNDL